MLRRRRLMPAVAGAALLILPVIATVSASSPVQGAGAHRYHRAVCSDARIGFVDCHALVETNQQGSPMATSGPAGLSPTAIDSAYGFPGASTSGSGETIAIVDAYNDPTAESDLGTFSGQYGLPACTTANGCFTKVNETGGTTYPTTDSGWSLEISLDIEWAHAVAPGAKILLVEASTNNFADLLTAEDYAKTHAGYVSNSWGGPEFSGESTFDSYFAQSGVSVFVAAGDSGLPAQYPSSSPNVISVGGTTLNFNQSGQLVSETGWSSGGGGCSAYETANVAQLAFSQYPQAGCAGKRATPDVAMDADPNSGVAVYDSTPYSGLAGWFTVGGTSAATPMWAAASADAGVTVNAAYVYGKSINFRDITSGNNGAPCLVGFDLCSGRGSWLFSSATSPTTTTTSTTTTTTSTTTTTTSTTTTTTTVPTSTTTTTTPGSPAVPVNLTAIGATKRVTLIWSEATTGVTFDLYRGTTSGGETLSRSGITGNFTTDTSVASGTTYYYEVAAVKAGIVSGRSNQVSVTPR